MSTTSAYFITRTMQALELLADAPRSTGDLARELQIHHRTASRMAARLADEGYIRRVHGARGPYRLTHRFTDLATRAQQQEVTREQAGLDAIGARRS